MNEFEKGDKVVVSDKQSMFYKKQGIVKYTFDLSTEVVLKNKITIVISYKKLKKVK